jgi:hypothetical protein
MLYHYLLDGVSREGSIYSITFTAHGSVHGPLYLYERISDTIVTLIIGIVILPGIVLP